MASKTTITLIDDTDGSEADQTVEFGVDGVSFEIDLSSAHADELRETLAQFIQAGRKVGTRRSTGGSSLHPVTRNQRSAPEADPNRLSREERDSLRMWAATNGYHISDRGRIAREVIDAWDAAGRP